MKTFNEWRQDEGILDTGKKLLHSAGIAGAMAASAMGNSVQAADKPVVTRTQRFVQGKDVANDPELQRIEQMRLLKLQLQALERSGKKLPVIAPDSTNIPTPSVPQRNINQDSMSRGIKKGVVVNGVRYDTVQAYLNAKKAGITGDTTPAPIPSDTRSDAKAIQVLRQHHQSSDRFGRLK